MRLDHARPINRSYRKRKRTASPKPIRSPCRCSANGTRRYERCIDHSNCFPDEETNVKVSLSLFVFHSAISSLEDRANPPTDRIDSQRSGLDTLTFPRVSSDGPTILSNRYACFRLRSRTEERGIVSVLSHSLFNRYPHQFVYTVRYS